MSGIVLLLTSADPESAGRIALALVEERLAACVQADRVRSVYRWKGAVDAGEETRLTVKTSAAKADAAAARLIALHPYDLPELVRIEAAAEAAYARWVEAEAG